MNRPLTPELAGPADPSHLGENDVRATGAHDGDSGLAAARQVDVDAVVPDLPIVMLTARGAVSEAASRAVLGTLMPERSCSPETAWTPRA